MSAAKLKYTSSGQRKEESPEIALITSQNYLKVKIIFGQRLSLNFKKHLNNTKKEILGGGGAWITFLGHAIL